MVVVVVLIMMRGHWLKIDSIGKMWMRGDGLRRERIGVRMMGIRNGLKSG